MTLWSAAGVDREENDVREEATAWKSVMRDAERMSRWAQADHARLYRGLCLHRRGRCEDAVTALLQARDSSDRPGAVAAQILCLRLLGWCGRHDDAAALWIALSDSTTPAVRESALDGLLDPGNSRLNEVDGRGHHQVCTYRRSRDHG